MENIPIPSRGGRQRTPAISQLLLHTWASFKGSLTLASILVWFPSVQRLTCQVESHDIILLKWYKIELILFLTHISPVKYEKGGVNAVPQSHPRSGDLPVRDLTFPSPQRFPFSPETESAGVEGCLNGSPESEKHVFGKG